LWTALTSFLDEAHLGSDLDPLESVMEHAVLVKVDLVPFGCFEKSVPLVVEELADATTALVLVRLGIAPLLVAMILKHAFRVVEGVVDGGIQVLVT